MCSQYYTIDEQWSSFESEAFNRLMQMVKMWEQGHEYLGPFPIWLHQPKGWIDKNQKNYKNYKKLLRIRIRSYCKKNWHKVVKKLRKFKKLFEYINMNMQIYKNIKN